jgi:hypothetical protein
MDNGNKKQGDADPMMAGAAFVLVVGALFYKKAAEIEFWLYEHLMKITGGVMGVFGACALVMLFRLKKKEGDHFERARAVRTVKATGEMKDYYKGG